MPEGILILARGTKIAEMSVSDPYEITFQFEKKSVRQKLKSFGREFAENLKKSRKFEVLDADFKQNH